jgi:predicted nucleic acid-binding protein
VIVVDASIGVKWFFTESDSEKALHLLNARKTEVLVPDFFAMEVAATLVRGANITKPPPGETQESLDRLLHLFESGVLHSERVKPRMTIAAARLAVDLGHPLKDCIYLALAAERALPMFTSDIKFAAKAATCYAGVMTLADFPA